MILSCSCKGGVSEMTYPMLILMRSASSEIESNVSLENTKIKFSVKVEHVFFISLRLLMRKILRYMKKERKVFSEKESYRGSEMIRSSMSMSSSPGILGLGSSMLLGMCC